MSAISDFQALIDDHVAPWAASGSCWSKGAEIGKLVLEAYKAQKVFLDKAIRMKKPNEEQLGELLGATSEQMGAVSELNDANQRDRDTALHSKTVAEGIQILAWVTIEKTPVPYCKETTESTTFHLNKVLQQVKGKSDEEAKWAKGFKELLVETTAYVKAHHTTGVAWGSASGDAAPAEEDDSAPTGGNSVQAYDEFLKTVTPFVKSAEALTPELGAAAASLEAAFKSQRAYLSQVETHSKPSDDEFMASLGAQIEGMGAVSTACEGVKNRDFDQHSKAIEEGAQLIAWVSVPTTVPHVTEGGQQVVFYLNKILMKNKGDDAHKAFCDSYKAITTGLVDYVKQEHKTGLAWKAGAPKLDAGKIPAAEAAPKAAAAVVVEDSKKAALFSDLEKGTDISKGLKKVTNDQKVHKNRKEGEETALDEEEFEKKKAALQEAAAKRAKKSGKWPTGEPKKAIEGRKWIVEYQVGTRLQPLEIEIEADKTHTVYVYGCQFIFLKINGKANALTLDKCHKTQVQFGSLIGQLEVTSSEACEVQTTGKLNAATMDNTNEFMLYLTRESLDCEITTSASTCINLTVPGKTDEDDPIEMNIPEQFVSRVAKGNKITTEPLKHEG